MKSLIDIVTNNHDLMRIFKEKVNSAVDDGYALESTDVLKTEFNRLVALRDDYSLRDFPSYRYYLNRRVSRIGTELYKRTN